VFLALGVPLVWALTGVTVLTVLLTFGPAGLPLIIMNTFGVMWNVLFMCIPMFIFMGAGLQHSGIGDDLFEMVHVWSGRIRGGLAMGVVVICAIFAAMTGVTAAATVTMGLVALPAMLSRNYDKSLALGCVAGPGTLGILIPPSVAMVILAVIGRLSVGKLFAAGIIPGSLLACLFISYIGIRGLLQPHLCPSHGGKFTFRDKIASLRGVILPIFIIFAVLGSIFTGVATPTEASAVGSLAVIIAIAIRRRLTWQLLKATLFETLRITGMVMWIIFGCVAFTTIFTSLGGMQLVVNTVTALELSPSLIIVGILVVCLILGMFLDPTGLELLLAPIGYEVVANLGLDPIWFTVLFVIALQVGFITPPFGYNLFYLKATAPPGISLRDIYASIWPFVGILIVGAIFIFVFPEIATWLPSVMITK